MGEFIAWTQGEYIVSTDVTKISLDVVHDFLANESAWAKNIPRPTVECAIKHSLCFSLLMRGNEGDKQIGFARVITDRATVAYLGDVFVLAAHRHKGLARWLMACVLSHPELQGLRRWILLTSDAHGLYEKFDFTNITATNKWMEKFVPNIYKKYKLKPDCLLALSRIKTTIALHKIRKYPKVFAQPRV